MPARIRLFAADQPVAPWQLADGTWAKAFDTSGVEWTTRENPNGNGSRIWMKARPGRVQGASPEGDKLLSSGVAQERRPKRVRGVSEAGDQQLSSGVALERRPQRVRGVSDEGDQQLSSGVALEVRPTRVRGVSDEGDQQLSSGVAREVRPERVRGVSEAGDQQLSSGVARETQSRVTTPAYIEAKARLAEARQAGEADDGMSPQQQKEQWQRVSATVCKYVDAGLASNPYAKMYIAVGMRERMSTNLTIAEAKDWACSGVCEIFRILLCPNPYAYAVIGGNMVKFNAKILRQVYTVHLLSRFSPPLPLSLCSSPPPMAVH